MGLETSTLIALGGLVLSAAGTAYGVYSSEKQAAEAEDIAEDNARRQSAEAEEMAQRAENEAAREESLSRARAAASGATGESMDLYQEDLAKTNQREIDWIRRSGASRADAIKQEGYAQASGYRSAGIEQGIRGAGNVAAGALDWYNTYSPTWKKQPSFDASFEHKRWS